MIKKGMVIGLASVISLAVAAAQGEQDAVLTIENAWVRALPPGQPNTAAYLTLVNRGGEAVVVESVSSDVADMVEIHTTRNADGLMRMAQLPSLEVASGQRLALAPGGTHLMLLGLETMPVAGDTVQLCLQFASHRDVCTSAVVRKSSDRSDSQGGQNHQHHQ
ncbi:MAG: copper chaperone PCu(A)C [Halioglobus sp.]|nr:copper chaperone PCu(A)C [Halioglobus sp.]